MRKFLFFLLVCLIAGFFECGKKLSEQELITKAREAETAGDGKKALGYYEDFVERFPGSHQHALALFMAGFMNANSEPKNLDKARSYYMEFKKLYPRHELINSVEFELQNLGKDPGEILANPNSRKPVEP